MLTPGENFRTHMTPLTGEYPGECQRYGIPCLFFYKGRYPNPYNKPEHFVIDELVEVEGRLRVLKKGKGKQYDDYYVVVGYDTPVHTSTLRRLHTHEVISISRDRKITNLGI